ncbi:putative regulatory protein cII [Cylindrospermum sp. NIES-4074]|nr:putative regulatory protein cII [Cylindrospermum sp. NIES-4074]
MKIISVFNNKGGVGKTTLTYHLACALAEMGKKILLIDFDPQCNLTIYGIDTEDLHKIWEPEDSFIDDFAASRIKLTEQEFTSLNSHTRTIHYLLKPAEDGTGELNFLPPPVSIARNLDLIPGRLTLHKYENRIAERWSGLYSRDPLSVRTVTQIRGIAIQYAEENLYDFVIIDTSPNLGALNKVIISTVDGFLVPCFPDMFSLYGIRNIGNSLLKWQEEFNIIYQLISDEKRNLFPKQFVRFLGFNIYNAKRYTSTNPWNLAQAAYNYALEIPNTIKKHIAPEVRQHLTEEMINAPIGNTAIMHSHNTLPSMAQKYRTPIWRVPSTQNIDSEDASTIKGNQAIYIQKQNDYRTFAEDLLLRINRLD